jgi:hypothetical protein
VKDSIGAPATRLRTQAHCLHLVANAVIYWNTIYTQLALDDLARPPAADDLAVLTPALFEHINPLGNYTFNTNRPAGQLGLSVVMEQERTLSRCALPAARRNRA